MHRDLLLRQEGHGGGGGVPVLGSMAVMADKGLCPETKAVSGLPDVALSLSPVHEVVSFPLFVDLLLDDRLLVIPADTGGQATSSKGINSHTRSSINNKQISGKFELFLVLHFYNRDQDKFS